MENLPHIQELLTKGQPIFGIFDRVEEVNYLDYHSYKLSGQAVSQWRKKLRANQFCFVQVLHPPYRVCVAVATLNWVTSSFCYLYNSETDEFDLVEALQPFTRNTQFNTSPYQDSICFKSGRLNIEMNFSADTLELSIEGSLNSKRLSLTANLQRPYLPLSVCTPTGKTGWTYTQKEPMTEIEGQLTIGEKSKMDKNHPEQVINLSGATATLDWTLGYLSRVTNWWWACITAYLSDGRHLGINLATGVNESGASENACWVDGKRYHLPAVMFRREQGIEKALWQISNQPLNWSKVKIDLTFTPVHCYKKSDRLIVVDSIFEQWIGYYSGTIELDICEDGGEVVQIDNLMGLAEDHYAKW